MDEARHRSIHTDSFPYIYIFFNGNTMMLEVRIETLGR